MRKHVKSIELCLGINVKRNKYSAIFCILSIANINTSIAQKLIKNNHSKEIKCIKMTVSLRSSEFTVSVTIVIHVVFARLKSDCLLSCIFFIFKSNDDFFSVMALSQSLKKNSYCPLLSVYVYRYIWANAVNNDDVCTLLEFMLQLEMLFKNKQSFVCFLRWMLAIILLVFLNK